ncbi:pro-resilin [Cyclospora cayetanensis]|uniref:Pro-resilin n=1 Tax=Cyclospora cayetanensis TaxID=88456 RepID=A0A6P6RZR4_9EIME|nr:pro-resilin [Cyclospora cayetanensis]
MDALPTGAALPCSASGVAYSVLDSSASQQIQHAEPPPTTAAGSAAATQQQQHQPSGAPSAPMQALTYPIHGPAAAGFVPDMGGPPAAYTSIAQPADTSPFHSAESLEAFGGGGVPADFGADGVESSPDRGEGSTGASAHGVYADVSQDQVGSCGGPLSGEGGGFGGTGGPAAGAPGSGASNAGASGPPPRSGIEKYLQWLDAIHTACSKLDDLCSKLDRSFPNATREWEATSPGIRGARQLFHVYADAQTPQPMQQLSPPLLAHGPGPSVHEEVFTGSSRKRQRRDNGAGGGPLGSHAGGGAGGLQLPQATAPGGLAQDFAGAGLAVSGRGGSGPLQQPPAGAIAAMGLGNAYGGPVVGASGKAVGGPPVSLSQPCGPPTLPGTANVLPPAGVPPAASAADGGEYEYLLDYPEQEAPDPDNPSDLKCDVAGVYWDKRSWIASWYEGGKRYYKSFSAKTHGFYRSKYWAIKVRLSKVQSHALAGKGCKARAAAA